MGTASAATTPKCLHVQSSAKHSTPLICVYLANQVPDAFQQHLYPRQNRERAAHSILTILSMAQKEDRNFTSIYFNRTTSEKRGWNVNETFEIFGRWLGGHHSTMCDAMCKHRWLHTSCRLQSIVSLLWWSWCRTRVPPPNPLTSVFSLLNCVHADRI